MKVVIDIPENDYELACNYPDALIACYAHYIKAGVPLPKKHGRLIDADEITFENAEFDTYGDYSRAFDAIDLADTVIEAEDSE
jgi:hypothetical protein